MQPKDSVMKTIDYGKLTHTSVRKKHLLTKYNVYPVLGGGKISRSLSESAKHTTIKNYSLDALLASPVRRHPAPKSEHGALNLFNFLVPVR
jgi:uridylate kinase